MKKLVHNNKARVAVKPLLQIAAEREIKVGLYNETNSHHTAPLPRWLINVLLLKENITSETLGCPNTYHDSYVLKPDINYV